MIRRHILLPLAVLALTGLSACGKEDPFEDKTYTGCLGIDSLTFNADGTLTAMAGGETSHDSSMKFKKISDTKVEITAEDQDNPAYGEILEDGTLSFTVPSEGIEATCQPQE